MCRRTRTDRPMCTSGSAKARGLANRTSASFSAELRWLSVPDLHGPESQPVLLRRRERQRRRCLLLHAPVARGSGPGRKLRLYDARVEGGIAAQNPSPPVGCTGEGCLDPIVSSPVFARPRARRSRGLATSRLQQEAKPKPLTRAQKLAYALKVCKVEEKPIKAEAQAGCEATGEKTIWQAGASDEPPRPRRLCILSVSLATEDSRALPGRAKPSASNALKARS